MKKLVLLMALFAVIHLQLQAQQREGNPFARLGYKADVYTFGEGKEFHDQKKVVEIGDVLFNTETGEVVGFVEDKDSLIGLKPELQSMSVDPLCEKYYSISPYAYCMNNPVNCIDPDGRDIWEINNSGEIMNRIEDKMQDTFYMVAKDAEGNYQRTFTVDAEGNKSYNSISFEYGTIESQRTVALNSAENYDVYKVRGDDNATKIFEFMGQNVSGSGSLVEIGQVKTGVEGDKGLNFVTTSHQKRMESGQKELWMTQLYAGYTLREMNHTHPTNPQPSGLNGDEGFALSVRSYLQTYGLAVPRFHIYHVPTKTYKSFGK